MIKNFKAQWKALKERKKGDEPDVPNISKALPVIKWNQAFGDYLDRIIGHHTIPLSYVVREEVTVPVHAPPLVLGHSHSEDHGSVKVDLVARASHTHTLYRDYIYLVYYKLEEATLSTPYAASIKPSQRPKDGQDAWLALAIQYSGQDKWEQELKTQDDMLHTRVWKGQRNFSLEKFIQQHMRASHTHTLYRDYIYLVYYKLEEATLSTPYAASIKPSQRPKDGRAAWLALAIQYSGQDKWEQELKTQDYMIHTLVWKGQSNFYVEKFTQKHRNTCVSI